MPNQPFPANGIQIDPSRCLRMRFQKSACQRCLDVCPANALHLGNALGIHGQACSQCMMCLSVCPSGTFQSPGLDFLSRVHNLEKIPLPVIGCSRRPDLPAHEKFPCMGSLSEEHLIALVALLPDSLQLNLTGCPNCTNGFIVKVLKDRLQRVAQKTSLPVLTRVRLVEDPADLIYKEVCYDRRSFFKILTHLPLGERKGLPGSLSAEEEGPVYSAKRIPFKRKILNHSLPRLPDSSRKEVLHNYYYGAALQESCDSCLLCVALCPTGALRAGRGKKEGRPLFNSALCSGCGLCENSCQKNSLHIREGFAGDRPSEYCEVQKAGPSFGEKSDFS